MNRAVRLNDLAKQGPFGRTKLFDLVRRGLLPARKVDNVLFVLETDWNYFLKTVPIATAARRPRTQHAASAAA